MSKLADADRLGFLHAVKSSFMFLSDYGFHFRDETPNSVTYASSTVSMFIYHEP